MDEFTQEKSQEDINDESAPKEAAGNPTKLLKTKMMKWVQERVPLGKKTKPELIVAAEKKFGIPYRTTSGRHDEETRPEEEPPPTVLKEAKNATGSSKGAKAEK